MIITPHLLLGAAIGAKIKHFGWIIVLGIVSHFILDKIPHWDYEVGLKKFSKQKSYKALFISFLKITIDGLIGLIIVFFIIWQKEITEIRYFSFVLVGILASLLPDFILGTILLFYNKFGNLAKNYVNFHENIAHYKKHITKPTLLGLGTEIIVSLIAIIMLLL